MANEEKENNEAAPVLNADEASNENAGGETLANSVGSEVVEASVETSVDNNEEAEPAEFDPQAFAGVGEPAATDENSEVEAENTEEKTTENAGTDNDGGDSDDGDDFVWPDLHTNSSEEEDKEVSSEEKQTESTEIKDENSSQEAEGTTLTDDQFKQFAKDLGLEANNLEEVKTVLDDLVKENKQLKEEVQYSGNTNKKIEDLEKFLKLDDENLMRKSLEADGLTGEKLDNAIEKYTNTGLLDVEALKVRSTLDKAIQSERQAIVKGQEAEVAKQQESRMESVKSFTEYMQSQDSLFGFKLTGDPDNLPKVRENHVEYVTSGKYLSEITSSEENLAQSSWLWRNREVLQKAFSNNGRQSGRAEILNKIGNPEKTTSTTFSEPGKPNEFDPQKFMKG